MLKNFIHRLLEPHHFWRNVGFSELSELYTSQALRSLAINMIGIFTAIYFYELGYSLVDIAFFYCMWFAARPFMDVCSGYVIARIGPKHAMTIANFMQVIYLALVLTLDGLGWPLWLVAVVGSMSYGLHILAVAVDFSKIKHSDHGGKELGYLAIFERIGMVIGPLVGGLIANYFDPRYSVVLAMSILLASSVPLLFTHEPVKTKQHITFKGLPVAAHKRTYLSVGALTIENTVSLIVWPIFIAVFVFTDNVFARVGLVAALGTLSSIVFTHHIGRLIDDKKGRGLLRVGAISNAAVHLFRPFATGTAHVLLINTVNEPVTAMYRMPYIKGLYDAADSIEGYRIAFLVTIAVADAVCRLLFWIAIYIGFHLFDPFTVLRVVFIVGAVSSLFITIEKFKALDEKN